MTNSTIATRSKKKKQEQQTPAATTTTTTDDANDVPETSEEEPQPADAAAVGEIDELLIETCYDPELQESISDIQRQMAELEHQKAALVRKQQEALEQCRKSKLMLAKFEETSLNSWMNCVGRRDGSKTNLLRLNILRYSKLHWTVIENMVSDGRINSAKSPIPLMDIVFADQSVLTLQLVKHSNGHSEMRLALKSAKNVATGKDSRTTLFAPLYFVGKLSTDRLVTADFSAFCHRAIDSGKFPSFSALSNFFGDAAMLLRSLMLLYVAGPDICQLFDIDLSRLSQDATQAQAEEMMKEIRELQPICSCCVSISNAFATLYSHGNGPKELEIDNETNTDGSSSSSSNSNDHFARLSRESLAYARHNGGYLDPVGFFRYCSQMFSPEERELVALLGDIWQLSSMEKRTPYGETQHRRTLSVADRHNMCGVYYLFNNVMPAYTSVLGKRKRSDMHDILISNRRRAAALLLQDFGLIKKDLRSVVQKDFSGTSHAENHRRASLSPSPPPPAPPTPHPAKRHKSSHHEEDVDDCNSPLSPPAPFSPPDGGDDDGEPMQE